MIRSGVMKRKSGPLGFWRTCHAELRHNELTLRDGPNSDPIRIDFGAETDIKLVSTTWTKFIKITTSRTSYSLKISDTNALPDWFRDLRSAAFYDQGLSIEHFELISVLGRGVFGKVTLA
jgi:hypothetical protein